MDAVIQEIFVADSLFKVNFFTLDQKQRKDAKNYMFRGMTMTPVISKVTEVLLENRCRDLIIDY